MKKLIIFFFTFLFAFDDKLYELMYKSFIYNKDYKNAYDITNRVLKIDKYNIKWLKRNAQLALYLKKDKEAYNKYLYLYKKLKDKNIEKILVTFPYQTKELIDIKINFYLKQFKKNNFKNMQNLVVLLFLKRDYKNIKKILGIAYKKTGNEKFFDMYMKYAILFKDIDVIKENLDKLKYKPLFTKIELAQMLIDNKDYKDAYKLLLYVKEIPKNKRYYELLVYVTYNLKRNDEMLKVLNYIYKNNLIDKNSFSLLLNYYYSVYDYKKLEELLRYAIRRFQFNVYKDYVDVLIKNNEFQKALEVLEKYKKEFDYKDYLKLKAYISYKLGNYKLATKLYKRLLFFTLNEEELKDILWFSINSNNYPLFKKVASRIDDNFLLAIGYLKFYKVDKAYEEIRKVKLDSLDKYLLLIDILNIRGVNSYKYKLEAFKLANNMLKIDNELLNKEDFLKNYIRLAIYFLPPSKIDKLFKKAKVILNNQDYFDLRVAYYFYLREYDRLFFIKNRKRDF